MNKTNQIKRTDIHCPSAIVPDDYEYVAFLPHGDGMGDCLARRVEIERINAHMKNTGGRYSDHEHGGSCDICGNVNAMTHVIFYHAKSNTYIRSGEICADKVGIGYDKHGLSVFKIAMRDATQLKAGKAKAQAILSGLGLDRAWSLWVSRQDILGTDEAAAQWNKMTRGEQIIDEMVGKLVKYGSLSEAQIKFLTSLVSEIDGNRAKMDARAQQRADEKARQMNSVYLGEIGQRMTFTAVVRFAKFIETEGNRFSDGYTITVMDDANDNVIVWMGRGFDYQPQDIKGQTVTFKATVKSHDDYEGVKQTKVTRAKLLSSSLDAQVPAEAQAPASEVAAPAPVSPSYGAGYDDGVDRRDPETVASLQQVFGIKPKSTVGTGWE